MLVSSTKLNHINPLGNSQGEIGNSFFFTFCVHFHDFVVKKMHFTRGFAVNIYQKFPPPRENLELLPLVLWGGVIRYQLIV